MEEDLEEVDPDDIEVDDVELPEEADELSAVTLEGLAEMDRPSRPDPSDWEETR